MLDASTILDCSIEANFIWATLCNTQTKQVEEPTVQTDASGSAVASAATEEPATTSTTDATTGDSAAESATDVTSSEATAGQKEDAPVAAAAMTADQQEKHKEEIGDSVSEKKADE